MQLTSSLFRSSSVLHDRTTEGEIFLLSADGSHEELLTYSHSQKGITARFNFRHIVLTVVSGMVLLLTLLLAEVQAQATANLAIGLIPHAVGAALVAWLIALRTGSYCLTLKRRPSFMSFLGGLFGTYGLLIAMMAIFYMGFVTSLASVMLGMLVCSMLVERFGLFQFEQRSLLSSRVAGLLLLVGGLGLTLVSSWNTTLPNTLSPEWHLGLIGLAISSGFGFVFQIGCNASLATSVRSVSFALAINFTLTFITSFLVLVSQSQLELPNATYSLPWWSYLGGFGAVEFVCAAMYLGPRMGLLSFVIALTGGAMLLAVLFDITGILGIWWQLSELSTIGLNLVLLGIGAALWQLGEPTQSRYIPA